jgi:hypothetical protein
MLLFHTLKNQQRHLGMVDAWLTSGHRGSSSSHPVGTKARTLASPSSISHLWTQLVFSDAHECHQGDGRQSATRLLAALPHSRHAPGDGPRRPPGSTRGRGLHRHRLRPERCRGGQDANGAKWPISLTPRRLRRGSLRTNSVQKVSASDGAMSMPRTSPPFDPDRDDYRNGDDAPALAHLHVVASIHRYWTGQQDRVKPGHRRL